MLKDYWAICLSEWTSFSAFVQITNLIKKLHEKNERKTWKNKYLKEDDHKQYQIQFYNSKVNINF